MFVFMGTYSPGNSGSSSSSNDSEDDPSENIDEDQSGLSEYTDRDEDTDEEVGEQASDEAAEGDTVSPGGSAGGGAGAIVAEPSLSDEDSAEDKEQDETLVITQEVDPLSPMSWAVQPVMKRVEERYRDQVKVCYDSAPVRTFEDPAEERRQWAENAEQLSMPVTPSFWDENPPESTELVNRACEAAAEQHRGEDYLRTLWMNGVAAGQAISDRSVLVDLASDIGLDVDQFEQDLDQIEVDDSGERDKLPFTAMEINGNSVERSGRIHYSDLQTQFIRAGLEKRDLRDLADFVGGHGPVATAEVIEVYEINDRGEAVQRLNELDGVSSFDMGGEQFWQLE